jgi:cytochrome c-type biogenesis protein CcmH
MVFWIIAACLSAFVCAVVAAPLARFNRLSWLMIAGVPLAAMGLYLQLGNPSLPDQPLANRDQAALQEHGRALAAADQLARQLAEDPDNIAGWTLLGQTWRILGRHGDAAQAFARAANLAPDNVTLQLARLEAMIAVEDGLISADAGRLIDRLMAVDPDDPGTRFYRGLQQWQAGDLAGAVAGWRALRADAVGDEPWLPTLERRLATVQSLGINP